MGEPKTGPSFSSLGNRMLDGNASEPALHWMCSRMPKWNVKEVQNRVREDLALAINDPRGIFGIWRMPIPVPQVRARVWAGGVFASSQLGIDGTGYGYDCLK
jgi:hypothetical protein